ncbi:MAG: sulfotransferase [Actinobacteria bacterium]|nr:sulfotransferase [Actinomycetota bacterium]
MPAVRRLFPTAVFVHLLRDGRDVALTDRGYFQLTAPTSDPPGWHPRPALATAGGSGRAPLPYRDFSRLVTFGKPGVRHWQGVALDDPRDVVANRYLLQIQAWMTAVTWARRDGASLGGGYHEVRYEELCTSPMDIARVLFRRLDLPWSGAATAFLERQVVPTSVGAWRRARLSTQETRNASL